MFRIDDLASDLSELLKKEYKPLCDKKFSEVEITDEDERLPEGAMLDEYTYDRKISLRIDDEYFFELSLATEDYDMSNNLFFKKAVKHGTAILLKEFEVLMDITEIAKRLLKLTITKKDKASERIVKNFYKVYTDTLYKAFCGLFAGRHRLDVYPCIKWKRILGYLYFTTGIPRSTLCRFAIALSLNTEGYFENQTREIKRQINIIIDKILPTEFLSVNLGLVLYKYKIEILDLLERRRFDEIVKKAILDVLEVENNDCKKEVNNNESN